MKTNLFRTKSTWVRRLSLVLGIAAGFYRSCSVSNRWDTIGPPSQESGHPWHNFAVNFFGNLAVEFALGFVAAWAAVRVIAWVVEGFQVREGGSS